MIKYVFVLNGERIPSCVQKITRKKIGFNSA